MSLLTVRIFLFFFFFYYQESKFSLIRSLLFYLLINYNYSCIDKMHVSTYEKLFVHMFGIINEIIPNAGDLVNSIML